jgi:hypothetical protein
MNSRFNLNQKYLPREFNILIPKVTKRLLRVGRNQDGGYIVDKNILRNIKSLVSFGMSYEFSFELDLLKINKNVKIKIFDHTVTHLFYLKNIFKIFRRFLTFRINYKNLLFVILDYFNFLKFIYDFRVTFYCLKIVKENIHKNEITPLKIFRNVLNSSSNILLKIDIEGDEYKVLKQVLFFHRNIDLMIIEFHNINKNKLIFFKSIKELNKYYYNIHLHGNNHCFLKNCGFPDTAEITLINKKKYFFNHKENKNFPIKHLDYPNNPHKKDVVINFN